MHQAARSIRITIGAIAGEIEPGSTRLSVAQRRFVLLGIVGLLLPWKSLGAYVREQQKELEALCRQLLTHTQFSDCPAGAGGPLFCR